MARHDKNIIFIYKKNKKSFLKAEKFMRKMGWLYLPLLFTHISSIKYRKKEDRTKKKI